MTALTAGHGHATSPWSAPAGRRPARSRHLVSVPTGVEAVATPTRVHLTRRGRLAITTTTLLAATLVAASLAIGGTAEQQVTVEPGQTLSHIAEAEMGGVPTREAVSRIQLANDISTGRVHAGQELVIPAS